MLDQDKLLAAPPTRALVYLFWHPKAIFTSFSLFIVTFVFPIYFYVFWLFYET